MSRSEIWVAQRPRLIGIAYRILGSWHDAEDVVSEVWSRFAAQEQLHNTQGWLTTVTTRLAIDRGRQLRARRTDYMGVWLPEPVSTDLLPDETVQRRATLRLGLLRVMDALEPEDRAIFVLREAFDVDYAEIAACVHRSPAACRQVVSRAKRRLPSVADSDSAEHGDQQLLTAILSALEQGDLGATVRLLSEDCVLWSDANGTAKAALKPIYGADKVARFLLGVTAGITVPQPVAVPVNGGCSYDFTWPGGRRLVTLEGDQGALTGIQILMNSQKLSHVW